LWGVRPQDPSSEFSVEWCIATNRSLVENNLIHEN